MRLARKFTRLVVHLLSAITLIEYKSVKTCSFMTIGVTSANENRQLSVELIWNRKAFAGGIKNMFARCIFAISFVGYLCVGGVADARQGSRSTGAQLPNTKWYWAISNDSGERSTVRDASGRTIETASSNRDRTTFRSASGRSLGTANQSRNQITFRDASGRTTGLASNNGNRTTFRDSSGRSTGSASSTGRH